MNYRFLCVAALVVLPACNDESPVAPSNQPARGQFGSKSVIVGYNGENVFDVGRQATRLTGVNNSGTFIGVFHEPGFVPVGLLLEECGCGVELEGVRVTPLTINDDDFSGGSRRVSGVDIPAIHDPFGFLVDLVMPLGGTTGEVRGLGAGLYPVAVGWVTIGGVVRAVRWDYNATSSEYEPTLLSNLAGGTTSAAYGVNSSSGLIVGSADDGAQTRVATWDFYTGTVIDIGIDGVAYDVNARGEYVGQTTGGIGFVHKPNGVVFFADDYGPGYTTSLVAVNNLGVAAGWAHDGVSRFPIAYSPRALGPIWNYGYPPEVDAQATDLNDSGIMTVQAVNANALNQTPLLFYTLDQTRDRDNDGIPNNTDNCPDQPNNDQDPFACDPSRPPVITTYVASTVRLEGGRFRFVGTAYDPGGRPLTLTWSFTDGTNLNGAKVDKTFDDDGQYEATFTADNGAGGVTSETIELDVTNVAPQFTPTVTEAPAGSATQLDIVIDDLGADAPFDATVRWGDGTQDSYSCGVAGQHGCTIPATHTYAVAGTYTARIAVTDKDLGVRRKPVEIVIP